MLTFHSLEDILSIKVSAHNEDDEVADNIKNKIREPQPHFLLILVYLSSKMVLTIYIGTTKKKQQKHTQKQYIIKHQNISF